MALRDASKGPDAMFSTGLAPSRGQWETIAQLSMEVLGVPLPQNRLQATVMIARLQMTAERMPLDGRAVVSEVSPV